MSEESTRAIDTAVGILVGWRRCGTQTAFRELLSASERQQVPLFAVARALVELTSGHTNAPEGGGAAEQGVLREWGEEFLDVGDVAPKVDRWL
ncbi:ANTAR domain-containing protein [Mycobacterium sp. ML4]